MNYQPRPHQQQMRDWLLSHDRAALFVGMGLGKTGATLAALDHLISDGDCKGALIIAPLRVSLFTWRDEVAKWDKFKWMRIVSLRTQEGRDAWDAGEACIYTLNYESIHIPRTNRKTGKIKDYGLFDPLLKGKRRSQIPVDTIIWDELSLAKNHSSTRIRHARKFMRKFRRIWGLTGTPAPNGLLDLFGQIKLIDEGERFGTHLGNFRTRYFEPENEFVASRFRKYVVRPGCAGLIEEKLSDLVLTQRSEDYLDIPPTEFIDIPVKLPAKVQRLYYRLEQEMLIMIANHKVKAVNKGVLLGKLMQIVGGTVYAEDPAHPFEEGGERVVSFVHSAKVEALRSLWESEKKKPMLVAVQYDHERQAILEAIPEAQAFSSRLLDDWNDGKVPLLVSHPAQMSHGLNMQDGGCRACWFSLGYSREKYDQLNARIARTGQQARTTIFRLVVPGSVDDAAAAALSHRGATQSGLLETLANLQTLAATR